MVSSNKTADRCHSLKIAQVGPLVDSHGSIINIGIDIGSTTAKAVVCNAHSTIPSYSTYRRHYAHQVESLKSILEDIQQRFGDLPKRMAISGSGGNAIADALGLPFIQEVIANSLAVQKLYPQAKCAIELGGQDAKMIFFSHDEKTGHTIISDMRMNGSCAGGTGAFIDEIAALLKIPIEEINDYATRATSTYSISGRCGVYAKTDIQPLLNQGASKEDLAQSTFHAIVKQTLGGLAQGLDIHPPIIFEGGPLTFNPQLIATFAQQLELSENEIIIPDHPETIVALGCALSLDSTFAKASADADIPALIDSLDAIRDTLVQRSEQGTPFFETPDELEQFRLRHANSTQSTSTGNKSPQALPRKLRAYLGIDSGSTTSKFVLIDEAGQVIDNFYSNNEGEPLDIVKAALVNLHERYKQAGIELEIIACGTTGYGEQLFAHAFHADYHVVETVAHARAACAYDPDASFVLDIGGQDMKAIWLENGIVTDIMVNEACSSGCGSFLEGFAKSLNIPTSEIAQAAFESKNPANLGSRCTVFMNSSVVTEQRCGKSPSDIMAGLCRSIIENVFTKVIRISNLEKLGDHIVVQGGTFSNDAVLAAFEQYLGKHVTRAPYPGLMGAIGAALLTREHVIELQTAGEFTSAFIGLDGIRDFSYTQRANAVCPFCANACSRTIMQFSDGSTWVTGNRCERGEILDDAKSDEAKRRLHDIQDRRAQVPNLFDEREELLFADYPFEAIAPENGTVIGLPRTLALWDNAPFWTTLLRSLGFTVRLSGKSTRSMYESGLPAVASDTVCFPAKLVHGHIRNLMKRGVDRIFMPTVSTVPTENSLKTSVSMCAVVKGYPLVIRNSDNPERRADIPFDNPLFHWYNERDRAKQLGDYFETEFGISPEITRKAIEQADHAQHTFRARLRKRGAEVAAQAREQGTYAVILAARPYHNDPLVNHDLPRFFTEMGIPIISADAIAETDEIDLTNSRLDIVNNFHARMLSSAVVSATSDVYEYVQVVSFGCGHDAYLSDEIARIHHELSGKTPLILKVDESDAAGPLRIRVRSFVETVNMRRKSRKMTEAAKDRPELSDPYPVKFERADRKRHTVLIPNTSRAFSRLMATVFTKQGLNAVPLDMGRKRAIELGKRYVHNDICFPAQIVIGEALAELETGKYEHGEVTVCTGKYIGDCRLTHYAALLRKALDDAGWSDVPIITNDDVDFHNLHPGFKMNTLSAYRTAYVLPMIDILEEMLRKIRPYELVEGASDEAFEHALDALFDGLASHGARGAKRGFERAVDIMDAVEYDRSKPRSRVLIVGEYLLNFHPGANHDVELYLEKNGFEIIEARMADVIQKSYFYKDMQVKRYDVSFKKSEKAWYSIADAIFDHAHNVADSIASKSSLFERPARIGELADLSDPIIDRSFDAGEGILIPAEILHHAARGCRNFLILQPFGCLPNHIVGRGISKRLKELYPDAQILPLDYDPDVSFANLENRLQMLVMNARANNKDLLAESADSEPHENDGDMSTGDSAQIIDLRNFADSSLDIAACAAAIATTAHSLYQTASETIGIVESCANKSIEWIAKQREELFEQLSEISIYSKSLAERSAAIVAQVQHFEFVDDLRIARMQELAQACNELAHQLNSETTTLRLEIEIRSDAELESIRANEGVRKSVPEAIPDEIQRFALSISDRMHTLDDRAQAITNQVTEILSAGA